LILIGWSAMTPDLVERERALTDADAEAISAAILPTHAPIAAPGDPIVVLITQGRLIGYSRGGERVSYEVNTLAGSGGSPVFTTTGDLIAMRPLSRPNRQVAEGVPIWRIRQAIAAAGHDPGGL
jgi:hypothetical protein